MEAAKRTRTLDATVTAKHTAEEETQIKTAAERASLTVSEWSRQTHLEALEVAPWARVLLQEILALRKIMLAIHLDVCHSQMPTEPRLRALVESAEATKQSMAEARLQAIRKIAQKEQVSE